MEIPVQTCLNLNGKTLPLESKYQFDKLPKEHENLIRMGDAYFSGQGHMLAGLFEVYGQIKGKYTLRCSRCLSEIEELFSEEIKELFKLKESVEGLSEEELETPIHEVQENNIDLLPFIEEAILVSIPFAPTCSSLEVCKENIPQEGKGWELVDADQESKKIDPRLAELAKFFDDDKS